MKTKSLSITALLIFAFSIYLSAEEDIKAIKSKLNEATVFLYGAELSHTASVSLSSGYNEIKIDKLSPTMDRNSLKIKASNGVVVSAFEFSVDEIPTKKPNESRLKVLNDSVELLTEELDKIKAEMKIDRELVQLMKKGVDRNISDTISITDLVKVMEYYQKKSSEIENRQIVNQNKKKKTETLLVEVNQRISLETVNEYEKAGILRISCTSPAVTNCTFTITYFTPSAQWIPYYDINILSTDRPIQIVSKAKVRQTTTVDWNKVKLTLSTTTPSHGKVAPLFNTWFLQYVSRLMNQALAQNAYTYGRNSKMDEVAAVEELSEIVVLTEKEKSMDDYITTHENDLNLTFNISLPYTIPGDGKEQSIDLKTQETTAEYKYYCAPKLDNGTYLLAEISDWQKLNLLSGKANITYDGTYMGETMINTASTHEKLSLTLGTDKRVPVKRELLKDYSSKKTFGKDIKQVMTYRMTVKNNQTKTIKMILKDQYPKSTNKDIEAELLIKETTAPTFHNEEVGVISWEEELKPGESKTYQISYSVKYPEGRDINL